MRRRLTHFLSEVRESVCERVDNAPSFFLFPSLFVYFSILYSTLCLSSFGYILRAYSFARRVFTFSLARAKKNLLRRSSIYPRASSGKYDFLHRTTKSPVISELKSWTKVVAFSYLCDSGGKGGKRRCRPTISMAQTYNQKRNVYSIDQILGHGKEDGKIFICLRTHFS